MERHWAEEQLRAERKKNIRLGIVERLDVTMARVQALHNQTRVQPQLVEHNVGGVCICVCMSAVDFVCACLSLCVCLCLCVCMCECGCDDG